MIYICTVPRESEEEIDSLVLRIFFQIVKICEQLEDAGNIERLAA